MNIQELIGKRVFYRTLYANRIGKVVGVIDADNVEVEVSVNGTDRHIVKAKVDLSDIISIFEKSYA